MTIWEMVILLNEGDELFNQSIAKEAADKSNENTATFRQSLFTATNISYTKVLYILYMIINQITKMEKVKGSFREKMLIVTVTWVKLFIQDLNISKTILHDKSA